MRPHSAGPSSDLRLESAAPESRPLIVPLGGYLGAGKTTLMGAAARLLQDAGHRVGVVTNDQGTDLVDTAVARRSAAAVGEVTGGCFCCRFDDLIATTGDLIAEHEVDMILVEAVGSCTDLVATVVRPLQEFHARELRVAPLTVVVDAVRWAELQAPDGGSAGLGELGRYLFTKQLEEASVIALNKTDRLGAGAVQTGLATLRWAFPEAVVCELSAGTGAGVNEVVALWSQTSGSVEAAGTRVLDVDYERYAAAEAELGWLNATVSLRAVTGGGFIPVKWTDDLLSRLGDACERAGWDVGHAKCSLETAGGWTKASVTRGGERPVFDARQETSAIRGELQLNARVQADPEPLEALIRHELSAVDASRATVSAVARLESFSPAPPRPTHRFEALGA